MFKFNYNYLSVASLSCFVLLIMLGCGGGVEGSGSGRTSGSGDGRRGEVSPLLPVWNRAPASRITHRNKGDMGDVDPRGSVRYNIGLDGKIMKGIITRHREVPVDDIGTGLFQATEECCHHNKYNRTDAELD